MKKSNLRKLIRKIISEQAPAYSQPKLIRKSTSIAGTAVGPIGNVRALTPTHTTIRPTSFPPYIYPDVGVKPEEEFDFPYEPDGVIGKTGIADLSSAAAATIQNLREQAAGCDAGHSLIVSKECSNPSAFTEYCLCCQIENQPVDPSMVGDFYEESQFGTPVIREILGVYGAVANDEYDVGEFKSNCGTTTGDPCDTSTSSPCAIQWFQNPNKPWAENWITARDCSNYTWPSINLEQQANDIMATAPNPIAGPYANATEIWLAGKDSDLTTDDGTAIPGNQVSMWQSNHRARFIAKTAKALYSQCQKQACNC
tara:strand:- start:82 stop:1017 length:936 start_codon:yes stop_codon:yes gene_type:complete